MVKIGQEEWRLDWMRSTVSTLTYNINNNLLSNVAPQEWTKEKNQNRIADIIEELNPDIFSIQEIPDLEFCYLFSNDYSYSNLVETHSGHVSMFVKHEFDITHQFIQSPFSGFRIMIKDTPIILIGAHLPPYKKHAELRYQILEALTNAIEPSEKCMILGDTNMREAETQQTVKQLGLRDAFLEAGEPAEHRFTWDSIRNPFHEDGFAFKARFDRILYRHLNLLQFKLIFDTPQSGENHFLSDHFGLYAEFSL